MNNDYATCAIAVLPLDWNEDGRDAAAAPHDVTLEFDETKTAFQIIDNTFSSLSDESIALSLAVYRDQYNVKWIDIPDEFFDISRNTFDNIVKSNIIGTQNSFFLTDSESNKLLSNCGSLPKILGGSSMISLTSGETTEYYSSLEAAVSAANNGDTIIVPVGVYKLESSLIIDKKITLKGTIGESINDSSAICGFQGSKTDVPSINIRVKASATLDSLWIDGGDNTVSFNGDNSKGLCAIVDLHDSTNAVIKNCKFVKSDRLDDDRSIAIFGYTNGLIQNNYFSGWYKAIYVELEGHDANLAIDGNTVIAVSTDGKETYCLNIAITNNCKIVNNKFIDGKVSVSGSGHTFTSNQFNNVILGLYDPSTIVLENAFIGETVIKNDVRLNLSANYWDGNVPSITDFNIDSWYTEYDEKTGTLSGLIIKGYAEKIYVDGKASDETGDGTKENPYKTISKALENVKYGQTIIVAPGTYNEPITITEGLSHVTLLGANAENDPRPWGNWNPEGTILTGGISITTSGTHETLIPNNLDALTVKGFDFQGKGFVVIGWWENGSFSNICIENNRFSNIDDNGNSAIHFNTSLPMAVDNLTISHNYIKNVGTSGNSPSGIYLGSAKGAIVIDNNYIAETNHSSIQVFNQQIGSLTITNNHLENWDRDNVDGGRAFRFTNLDVDSVTISGNALLRSADLKGDDLNDTYLKISNSSTFIDASKNYWNGLNPTDDGFPISVDANNWLVNSWYTGYNPTTGKLSGLATVGGSGTVNPPYVPPVDPKPEPETPVVPTPDEEGNVEIQVPVEKVDEIVEEAKNNGSDSVTVADLSTVEGAASATVSTSDLQNILDKIETDDSLTNVQIELPEGSVTIEKEILAEILQTTEAETLTIKVSDVSDEIPLTEEQKKIIGNSSVFDISIIAGEKKVTSFSGKTITVCLPYELKDGEDPSKIVVYYVKDDGSVEKMDCVYKDGNVYFETNHLSHFSIVYEAEPVAEDGPSNDDNLLYYILAAIVIILVIIAVAYWVMKK